VTTGAALKIAYFYLMKTNERVKTTVPEHVAYWHKKAPFAYQGGPFADRSGGLITFESDSFEAAEEVIAGDPFVLEALEDVSLVKEWLPE
jgi:uncharacterized protein YciI